MVWWGMAVLSWWSDLSQCVLFMCMFKFFNCINMYIIIHTCYLYPYIYTSFIFMNICIHIYTALLVRLSLLQLRNPLALFST